MSPNNICQHLCTIQFVSMKIFLQAKMIKMTIRCYRGSFVIEIKKNPFSSPMPQFVWVMVPRHESRGQNHVSRNKRRERNFSNFLIFVWGLEGNLSQSSFFLQCSKTLSASRFTHCYSLKLNAAFFLDMMKLVRIEFSRKYYCKNVPRFMFPDAWLSHHFPTVVTVVWWTATDALLFAGHDERVSVRSQPSERAPGVYTCPGMGACFSVNVLIILNYSV